VIDGHDGPGVNITILSAHSVPGEAKLACETCALVLNRNDEYLAEDMRVTWRRWLWHAACKPVRLFDPTFWGPR
jgi:hypothetical protein